MQVGSTKERITADKARGLIALGASTGGTEATSVILKELPASVPGIVIVQHMPPVFTKLYAERLNKESALTVKEAEDCDVVLPGHAYVAPGDKHVVVIKTGGSYTIRCSDGDKVNGHRPSVDVMFHSVAKFADKNTLGIILTGMGADGAKGLLAMRQKGAYTIGQDEKSSVVYGMPMVAKQINAVTRQAGVHDIAKLVLAYLSR
ncbi:MAG: CheB methylesterase domain-containing protein [Christensenellaceae bacterium]|jgi:two-component system chemotaxis response regulator CheB